MLNVNVTLIKMRYLESLNEEEHQRSRKPKKHYVICPCPKTTIIIVLNSILSPLP